VTASVCVRACVYGSRVCKCGVCVCVCVCVDICIRSFSFYHFCYEIYTLYIIIIINTSVLTLPVVLAFSISMFYNLLPNK
jgi:hypothetical protein